MSWVITGTQKIDPDALAYLTEVERADGQALESGVRDAVIAFVAGCKTDGIWSAIKASCILMGARTLNGALVPLVGTAPTNYNFSDYQRKTGIKKTGATVTYLDTGVAGSSSLVSQNNVHMSVGANERNTTNPRFIGTDSASVTGACVLDVGNNVAVRLFGSASSTFFGTSGTFWGGSRSGSTNVTILSGGTVNTYSQSSATPVSANFCVGGSPNSGTASTNSSRFYFYSIGTSIDLALLDSRVATLNSAITAAIP